MMINVLKFPELCLSNLLILKNSYRQINKHIILIKRNFYNKLSVPESSKDFFKAVLENPH